MHSDMPAREEVLVMKAPFAVVRRPRDSHYFVRQAMALCFQLVIPVKTGSSLALIVGHPGVEGQAVAG